MQYCEARAVECPLEQTIKLQGELVTTGRQEVCSRQQGSLRLYRGQAGVRQGSGRGQEGIRQGSGRGQQGPTRAISQPIQIMRDPKK